MTEHGVYSLVPSPFKEKIMTKLEAYMNEKNWTSEELASKLGRSEGSVQRYMRIGLKKHNATIKYARAMGCSINDIKGVL